MINVSLKKWIASPEIRVLSLLLLLALGARIGAAFGIKVISHDGARFTVMARALKAGDSESALQVEPRMPLLYPLSIVAAEKITGDLRTAGQLLSILFGTLALIPIYLLARAAWNVQVAQVAGAILAVFPEWTMLGGEVWTEPMFLCLFFSSIAAIWFACEKPAVWKFALAGLLGGLAVNTRPEGIYTVGALIGWSAVAGWIHRREAEGRWVRVAGPILFLAVFVVLIYPYSKWIHERFGFWSFTPNQFAAKLLGGPNVESSFTEGYNLSDDTFEMGRDQNRLLTALKVYYKVNAYVFLPLLIVGFFFIRRRGWNRGVAYMLLVALGYALPTWLGLMKGLPFGDRYVLPSFLVLTPVMAIGLLAIPWPRLRHAALAVILLACFVRVVLPHEEKRQTLADAGRWIQQRYGSHKWIVTMDRRVEHYADGFSQRAPGAFTDLVHRVDATQAVAVVVYDRYVERHEKDFERRVAAAWPLVHTVPKGSRGHEVRIYEVTK